MKNRVKLVANGYAALSRTKSAGSFLRLVLLWHQQAVKYGRARVFCWRISSLSDGNNDL
jgi:hypothetical protein